MPVPYTTRTVSRKLTKEVIKESLKEENVPTMQEVDSKIEEAILGAINESY